MSLVDIKTTAREKIHAKMAVPCDLVDEDHPDGLVFADDYEGDTLTVRYHTKLDRTGDLDDAWGDVIDGIDRLVFLDSNVAAVSDALVANGEAALTLSHGAQVTIEGYKGLVFRLDTKEPPDGPAETAWVVARSKA